MRWSFSQEHQRRIHLGGGDEVGDLNACTESDRLSSRGDSMRLKITIGTPRAVANEFAIRVAGSVEVTQLFRLQLTIFQPRLHSADSAGLVEAATVDRDSCADIRMPEDFG